MSGQLSKEKEVNRQKLWDPQMLEVSDTLWGNHEVNLNTLEVNGNIKLSDIEIEIE